MLSLNLFGIGSPGQPLTSAQFQLELRNPSTIYILCGITGGGSTCVTSKLITSNFAELLFGTSAITARKLGCSCDMLRSLWKFLSTMYSAITSSGFLQS